ncbi:hypothetical protein AB0L71_29735 [Streptomyces sp. NPDC052052]|uniref:hypothetical protein n=1 Tax=Streptomyces sp. NPDC052052 TaxID=3154756 RepID=UPI00342272DC
MGRTKRVLIPAITAGVFTLTALTAYAAVTDNMYPTANANWNCWDGTHTNGLMCQTDNSALTAYVGSSLTSTGRSNVRAAMSGLNSTDLSVSYHSSPVKTGDSETDIIAYKPTWSWGVYPSGVVGVTWCNDAVTSRKCDQHYVAFKTATPSKNLACHETGHAVGLTHGQDASPRVKNTNSGLACMVTPLNGINYLGSSNKELINSTY